MMTQICKSVHIRGHFAPRIAEDSSQGNPPATRDNSGPIEPPSKERGEQNILGSRTSIVPAVRFRSLNVEKQ